MKLIENLAAIKNNIEKARIRTGREKEPPVKIIAVTKKFPPTTIEDAYKAGLTVIGENQVQEAEHKFTFLPDLPGLKKRMIGHLQSNKVNKAVEIFDTIDSVDSLKTGLKISSQAVKLGIRMPILIQVNTSGDPAKFGFSLYEEEEILSLSDLKNLRVDGLMTIGIFTNDESLIRDTFVKLRELKDNLNRQLPNSNKLIHLSMGMSGDYEIAAEEGATMVRLGTELFGKRPSKSV